MGRQNSSTAFRQAAQGVVIGEGKAGEPSFFRRPHQLPGGKFAVGPMGMYMKIKHHGTVPSCSGKGCQFFLGVVHLVVNGHHLTLPHLIAPIRQGLNGNFVMEHTDHGGAFLL